MAVRHIIPVAPANGDGPVVVVEVRQEGPHPLDVQLVGCEGENPYVTAIKHRHLGKLKRQFKGSDEEWEAIVSHFLLEKQPEKEYASILDEVRLVYSLDADHLVMTMRRDVKGIKVTLGELVLPQDVEFEINPFEWAQISAQAHNAALRELAELKGRVDDRQGAVEKLKTQLDDFIKTKDETEAAMLQQFMMLLNEKKRKIRDQQRLLAAAKVDKGTASAVRSAREETRPRKAGTSRTSKRKASGNEEPPELEPQPEPDMESDDMDVDEVQPDGGAGEAEDESEGAATPDQTTDDDTEDEDEDQGGTGGGVAKSAPRFRERSDETSNSHDKVAQASQGASTRREPPPKRELPFGRPNTRNKATENKGPRPPADEDDETEDEEL